MKKVLGKVKEMRFGNLVAMLALTVATISVNSACALWIYQEEETEELKKLRKF